ncbi:hypothetical protein ACR6C2_08445 [Streptomyces sp. INA 01156]
MTNATTELGRALRDLGEHGDRLTAFAASPEQLDEIGADLDRVRRLLADARAELGPSGCRVHPGAPPDPEAGGACLFCATNRRRGQTPAGRRSPRRCGWTRCARSWPSSARTRRCAGTAPAR